MAQNTTDDKFTVLLVHAAWHTPALYQPTVQELHAKGYPVAAPHLPTCDQEVLAKHPNIDMKADAQLIESEISRLVMHEDKQVLILAHSYGGVPAMEAVPESMSRKHRAAHGHKGGVIGILCVSAFMIVPNTTLEDLNGGEPAPFVIVEHGMTTTRDPGQHFFSDIAPADRAYYESMLVPQPRSAHSCKLTRAAYEYIPTGYVFCEQDQASPLFIQQAMVKNVQRLGVEILEYRIGSGHSPAISQPQRLVEIMLEFASSVNNKA